MLEHIIEDIRRKQAGMYLIGDASAKMMVGEAKAKASWTDRTGATRAAIDGGVETNSVDAFTIYLAHNSEVGMYHELGTGIYGPKKSPIVPMTAKVLRFKVDGKTIFAKSVKGIPANPILMNTADANRDNILKALGEYWNE